MKLIMAKKKKKAYTKISYFARTKYDVLAKVDSGRNMVPKQNIVSQHKFFPGDVWRPDAVCRMDDNGLTAQWLKDGILKSSELYKCLAALILLV